MAQGRALSCLSRVVALPFCPPRAPSKRDQNLTSKMDQNEPQKGPPMRPQNGALGVQFRSQNGSLFGIAFLSVFAPLRTPFLGAFRGHFDYFFGLRGRSPSERAIFRKYYKNLRIFNNFGPVEGPPGTFFGSICVPRALPFRGSFFGRI